MAVKKHRPPSIEPPTKPPTELFFMQRSSSGAAEKPGALSIFLNRLFILLSMCVCVWTYTIEHREGAVYI